jgi:septal ring factor EnvC (AmiA/AmiB activator)
MDYKEDLSVWTQKGATLSDKTAQKEFDITREEIIGAIKAGKLCYRHNTLFGNPCLKLLRHEVEAFVDEKYGENHLQIKKTKTELKKVSTEIGSLKRKIIKLEKRKKVLSELLSNTK